MRFLNGGAWPRRPRSNRNDRCVRPLQALEDVARPNLSGREIVHLHSGLAPQRAISANARSKAFVTALIPNPAKNQVARRIGHRDNLDHRLGGAIYLLAQHLGLMRAKELVYF